MRPEQIKYLVVHCSATPPNMDIGRAEIDRWHRERGWSGIGYHLVVRRNGMMELGRDWGEPGAHAQGYNSCSIGICLVGGIDEQGKSENNFTPAQMESLRAVLNVLKLIYRQAEILGHRDLPGVAKDCPCFDVRSWWLEAAA